MSRMCACASTADWQCRLKRTGDLRPRIPLFDQVRAGGANGAARPDRSEQIDRPPGELPARHRPPRSVARLDASPSAPHRSSRRRPCPWRAPRRIFRRVPLPARSGTTQSGRRGDGRPDVVDGAGHLPTPAAAARGRASSRRRVSADDGEGHVGHFRADERAGSRREVADGVLVRVPVHRAAEHQTRRPLAAGGRGEVLDVDAGRNRT